MVVVSDAKPLMEHTPQSTSGEREKKLENKIKELEEEIKQFKADHPDWDENETHEKIMIEYQGQKKVLMSALYDKPEGGANGFRWLPLSSSLFLLLLILTVSYCLELSFVCDWWRLVLSLRWER